ncbi:MAG: GntR family transcriptional regulator [Sphaerochaetaceae bacterium]|nr:GntR family transcriptional regulator [Sphaerochaetaceae bacterium]
MKNKKFLYETIYEEIKTQILNKEIKQGSLLPSEKELSEKFHANRTTIRKALLLLVDDNLVVKEPGIGTRVYIQLKDDSIRNNNPLLGTIALVLPPSENKMDRISQPFYSEFFYFAEKELQPLGYTLLYSSLDNKEHFESLIEHQKLDGIIFMSNIPDQFIDIAKINNIPSILVNNYSPNLVSILSDNVFGMGALTDYLISLGHKSFILFTGLTNYLSTKERLIGCTNSFLNNNIKNYEIENIGWDPNQAYLKALEIFKRDKIPTAFICFNDNLAFGCLRAAREVGLNVPEDLSIVGYDNINQSRYFSPPLTTVNSNIPTISKLAVQNLTQKIKNPDLFSQYKIVVPFSLKIRESASAPNMTS